ncbi:MAG: hypothetical protein JWQ35_159 [Bacteriovoracaceae bacterium]|nr:hypothetical protein [Bacteriovoracaceae bacterium]
MALTKLAVGSDIKYLCSKCNLELSHTIIAMIGSEPARIRCNTCRTERNYRRKKVTDLILRPGAPRPKIMRPDMFQAKLQENLMKTPKTYRIDQSFEVNDVIQHPSFGKGVVIKAMFPDRVEVLFQDQSRVLMCKLDGTSAE